MGSLYLEAYRDNSLTLEVALSGVSVAAAKDNNESGVNEAMKECAKAIDDMIAIKGPKNLEEQEAAIDKALEQYKIVIASIEGLYTDPSGYDAYEANLSAVSYDLIASLEAYKNAK